MTRTAAAAPPEQRRHDGDDHDHEGHGHSHGLVDPSIKRSREGLRVVGISLALLAVTAVAQGAIYVATGSIALLADLIHNFGDALTAVPLGAAFLLRSDRAERGAGIAVVLTILASAVTAGVFAVARIVHPLPPKHLLALGLAGAVGVVGNAVAARVRQASERVDHRQRIGTSGVATFGRGDSLGDANRVTALRSEACSVLHCVQMASSERGQLSM